MALSWSERNTVKSGIVQISRLYSATAYSDPTTVHFAAAISHSVICLNDALVLLDDRGTRVDTREDVSFEAGKPKDNDLTALIRAIRNVICHRGSDRHNDAGIFLQCVSVSGVTDAAMLVNGKPLLSNPYPDDLALFWGPNRLLINRNLLRAAFEAYERVAAPHDERLPFDHMFRRSPSEFCGSVRSGWRW